MVMDNSATRCEGMVNEQVVYKREVARPKKTATGINYCQNGRLATAKVTTCVLDTGS